MYIDNALGQERVRGRYFGFSGNELYEMVEEVRKKHDVKREVCPLQRCF